MQGSYMNESEENSPRCVDRHLIYGGLPKALPAAHLPVLGEACRLVPWLFISGRALQNAFFFSILGPHPVAMFEVNVFDPHQTGALFSFLAVNRGPCSSVFFYLCVV
jgi:hypothetical protein